MKSFFLMTISTIVLSTFCKAQFPAFTNFEGVKYYEDTRGDTQTKKYRDLYNIGNKVDSYFADSLRKRAKTREKLFKDSIVIVIADSNFSAAEKNSKIIIMRDSIQFYNDVKVYYASINKFTGKPRLLAKIFPVVRNYQAKFFYQNSPKTDSSEKNVDFLSNFVLQSNINKTAISSDLISGALWIFKASISTTVVDNNDTTNAEKVSNKINLLLCHHQKKYQIAIS